MSEITAQVPERPVMFDCCGLQLCGILHEPPPGSVRPGVLVVVGGPQYRIGSHRQFVHLARGLAKAGHPVFRFDYRGMGDSEGDLRDFQDIDADIRAAIDAFQAAHPVQSVVIWGLCDAASAAAFYGYQDSRVTGLALVNPWIRTERGAARAQIRHYYVSRFRDGEFWRKLARMRWNPGRTLLDAIRALRRAFGYADTTTTTAQKDTPLPDRVYRGLSSFDGNVLVVLSGRDLTAREFEVETSGHRHWQEWLARPRVELKRIREADHTFSSLHAKEELAKVTNHWLSGQEARITTGAE